MDVHRANQLIVFEHWDAECRPITGKINGFDDVRTAFDVRRYRLDVGDVDDLLCGGDTSYGAIRSCVNERLAPPNLDIGGRGIMHCGGAEFVSFGKPQCAEFRLAEANCVREHGLEHCFQPCG
jgi:hypothetical protein